MTAEELVRACLESSSSDAWVEFVSRFQRSISLSVIRTARLWEPVSRPVVDDLVQETYLKLCADGGRLLGAFAVRHPEAISGYIRMTAINVTRDYFKSQRCQKRGAGLNQEPLVEDDLSLGLGSPGGHSEMERQVLLSQIARCLEKCSAGKEQERDRLIFWLYYRNGLSAKAIAALPSVDLTAKGVESVILRITSLVREEIVQKRLKNVGENQADQKGFRSAESY